MSERKISRREALTRAGSMFGAGAAAGSIMSACGYEAVVVNYPPGSSSDPSAAATSSPSALPSPSQSSDSVPYDITTPVGRLKAFLAGSIAAPYSSLAPYLQISVSQGTINAADPVDSGCVIYPSPAGFHVNPNPATLADIPQIWGYRRDVWSKQPAVYFNSTAQNASWYVPVARLHTAATAVSFIPVGLHFIHTGQSFEVLFAGTTPTVTLIADGRYCTNQFISTNLTQGVSGSPLSVYNTFTKFDFGSTATRRISLYGLPTDVGPCAIAIGPEDTIQPWNRASEPSFSVMCDSYGQGYSSNWFLGGSFWVAASLLGIPHFDLNTMGGTGYAPVQSPFAYTSNPGNTFGARLADSLSSMPDMFLTAGGINDDYGLVSPPLYPTASSSMSAFTSAVGSYYSNLRTALPGSVIAAMGPWAPKQSTPTNALAQAKLSIIALALSAISGPWIMIDNLNGGWTNSSGTKGPAIGPWQTGTGNVGAPTGVGNGDLFVSADGTHPTPAGNLYLGHMLASNLAAGILAL